MAQTTAAPPSAAAATARPTSHPRPLLECFDATGEAENDVACDVAVGVTEACADVDAELDVPELVCCVGVGTCETGAVEFAAGGKLPGAGMLAGA
jgi:hypothetical protein